MTDRPFLSGVIEGFYGRPWSRRQRQELFGWLQRAGLNTYMYAPKDDLKHRALWRAPYDPEELAGIRELVGACAAHGLDFLYAIAPGLDVRFTDDGDRQALVAKVGSVAALGVRHFALLFDDIPATLDPADAARFVTPAAAQSDLANALLHELCRQDGGVRLIFCPTAYCGRMAQPSVSQNPYLRELGRRLTPEIDVFWTGPHIVSDTIPVESIRELAAVLGRLPVIWDNLFANDYDMRRLYLGPFAGRGPELRGEVSGILLNPNCQFEANPVAVQTLGAYLAEAEGYAAESAGERALAVWVQDFEPAVGEALIMEELRLLADFLHLPTEFGPGAKSFLEGLERLRRDSPVTWGEVAGEVAAVCVALNRIFDKLTCLKNRSLLHALYPHAWELKEIGQFLQVWM
ncbi:MAG: beta-N-acetylglucosaminidase domain-containing protein, partial [Verrucomicrobiae bacterium]|nr:beta-N-acetylglucosaminidase domain-containing protein [Verrucomicrobiae bacterium]